MYFVPRLRDDPATNVVPYASSNLPKLSGGTMTFCLPTSVKVVGLSPTGITSRLSSEFNPVPGTICVCLMSILRLVNYIYHSISYGVNSVHGQHIHSSYNRHV